MVHPPREGRHSTRIDPAHPWPRGCTVFSRQYGIGKIRSVEWVTGKNANSSLLVYVVRFAGETKLVDMASPMLHLLEGPMWLTDSRAFDDERDRQLPRTVNAPQRVRELNDAMLQTVDREHDLRLWQIVVVELPTHRIGPVRAQLRLLQKGRTVYMYELRRFGSLPLKDEEKVTVHAELTTSTGVVLSTFARGAVIGLPHRLDAPTSVRFDSA